MHQYDLIVFDWDGTLMDSTGLIAQCIQLASRDLGLPEPTEAAAKYIIGMGIADSTKRLFPELSEQRRLEFALHFRGHFVARDHEAPLYVGVREMLEALRQREKLLAVATGKPRRGLERAFLHTGLKPVFDFSRCADEGFPKPNPDMLLTLMDFAGVEKDRVLMIGDTTHDLELAANAGVDALAVSYGAHPACDLARNHPLECLSSVAGLHTWLTKNA